MSSIADVRDMDCVKSFNPLVLGMTGSIVVGVPAILRRVLYRWCTRLGTLRHDPTYGVTRSLLDMEGATFAPSDIQGLRAQLEEQAKEEAFVGGASVPVSLSREGLLYVSGSIRVVDGRTELLEVSASAARTALLTLGGA